MRGVSPPRILSSSSRGLVPWLGLRGTKPRRIFAKGLPMKVLLVFLIVSGLLTLSARIVPAQEPRPLQAVPFTSVQLDDPFWSPRLQTVREKTLWHNFRLCEDTGRLANFDKAAGVKEGKHEGYLFDDSDVYKAIEGAAYALSLQPDPKLDKYLDDLIARIAKAQREDGYLNTYYTLTGIDKRWTNLRSHHELYCAGHLIEAGIAHHQATGKRNLLDVAIKFADCIASIFGPDQRRDIPGHPEIELAFIKLTRHTGEQRYQKLAQFFVGERGQAHGRQLYGEYCQDQIPLRQQREVVGHAVRAMYLNCAATDLAAAGEQGYTEALEAMWRDLTERRMYVTGGIGPSASNEGFTTPYDLPNDTAYAETCAGIGLALWNHRMGLLHADAKYADVLERSLYNGILSGISLDGTKFFYTNPLADRGKHRRRSWFGCACCPPNLLRFFLSVGGYAYAYSEDTVFVNQYLGGKATVPLAGGVVELAQTTRYPWEGEIKLTVRPAKETAFALCLRIPGWCDDATITVNGQPVEKPEIVRGYARLLRTWKSGDVVDLVLAMPARTVEADPLVKANVGRVAIQRGPMVYCLEGLDNEGQARRLALPRETDLVAEFKADLLGGVMVVRGVALAASEGGGVRPLYRAAASTPVEFTAIPYYAWANREPSEMIVWLPESPTMLDVDPVAGVKPSASHCGEKDTVAALCDRSEPESSSDTTIPRHTWWDHRGTEEWIQYDFDKPRWLSSVSIYWYDDTKSGGNCRVPASWRLLYRQGGEWKPVKTAVEFGVKPDQYNRVSFDSVETDALRAKVTLEKGFSGGVLEWELGDQ